MIPKRSDIKHFLLVFDREVGHLIQQRDFGTKMDEAIAAYQRLEREHFGDPRYDILLVGSDSIETVKVTHASYFREGLEDLEQYLRSVMEDAGVTID
ncbi:MAG: hypothetical protein Q4D96_07535 [Propionibacteriaceae bacterium]|nr:hypothetical protein [Propionibacteriaceae bacterium]